MHSCAREELDFRMEAVIMRWDWYRCPSAY